MNKRNQEIYNHFKKEYDLINEKIKNFDVKEHRAKIKVAVFEPSLEELIARRKAYRDIIAYLSAKYPKDCCEKFKLSDENN